MDSQSRRGMSGGLSNAPSRVMYISHNAKDFGRFSRTYQPPNLNGVQKNFPRGGTAKSKRPPSARPESREEDLHTMFNKQLESEYERAFIQYNAGQSESTSHPNQFKSSQPIYFIPNSTNLQMPQQAQHHLAMFRNPENPANTDNIGLRTMRPKGPIDPKFIFAEQPVVDGFGYEDMWDRPSIVKIGVQTRNSSLAAMKPIRPERPPSVRVYENDDSFILNASMRIPPPSRSRRNEEIYGSSHSAFLPPIASKGSKKRNLRKPYKNHHKSKVENLKIRRPVTAKTYHNRFAPIPPMSAKSVNSESRIGKPKQRKWRGVLDDSKTTLASEPSSTDLRMKSKPRRGVSRELSNVPSNVMRNSHNTKGLGRFSRTFKPQNRNGVEKNLGGTAKPKGPSTAKPEPKEEDLNIMFNKQLESEYQRALDQYNNYEKLNEGLVPEGTDAASLNHQFKSFQHIYCVPKSNNLQMPLPQHHPTMCHNQGNNANFQNPENPANPDNIGLRPMRPKGLVGPSVRSIFAEQPVGAGFGYVDVRDQPGKVEVGVQTRNSSLAAMKPIPLRPERPESVRVYANDNSNHPSIVSTELNSSILNSSMITPPPSRWNEEIFVPMHSTFPPLIAFKGSKKKRKELILRKTHKIYHKSKEENLKIPRPVTAKTYDIPIPIVPPPPVSAKSYDYTDSLIDKLRRNILSVLDDSKTALVSETNSSIFCHVIPPPPENVFILPPIAAPPPREFFSNLSPCVRNGGSGLQEQFPYQLAVHEIQKAEISKEVEKNSQRAESVRSSQDSAWKYNFFHEQRLKEEKKTLSQALEEKEKTQEHKESDEKASTREINNNEDQEENKKSVYPFVFTSEPVPFQESMREDVWKQLAGIFNKDQPKFEEVLYPVKLLNSGSLSVSSNLNIPTPADTPPPSPLSADSSRASLEGQVSNSIIHLLDFPSCDCSLCHRNQMESKDSFIDTLPYVQPNYIELNRKRLKAMDKTSSNPASAVVVDPKGNKAAPMKKLLGTPGFGRVPPYIQRRKREFLKAKEGDTQFDLRNYMSHLLREISGDGGNNNYSHFDFEDPALFELSDEKEKEEKLGNRGKIGDEPLESKHREEIGKVKKSGTKAGKVKANKEDQYQLIILSTREFSRLMREDFLSSDQQETGRGRQSGKTSPSENEARSKTSDISLSDAEQRCRRRNR